MSLVLAPGFVSEAAKHAPPASPIAFSPVLRRPHSPSLTIASKPSDSQENYIVKFEPASGQQYYDRIQFGIFIDGHYVGGTFRGKGVSLRSVIPFAYDQKRQLLPPKPETIEPQLCCMSKWRFVALKVVTATGDSGFVQVKKKSLLNNLELTEEELEAAVASGEKALDALISAKVHAIIHLKAELDLRAQTIRALLGKENNWQEPNQQVLQEKPAVACSIVALNVDQKAAKMCELLDLYLEFLALSLSSPHARTHNLTIDIERALQDIFSLIKELPRPNQCSNEEQQALRQALLSIQALFLLDIGYQMGFTKNLLQQYVATTRDPQIASHNNLWKICRAHDNLEKAALISLQNEPSELVQEYVHIYSTNSIHSFTRLRDIWFRLKVESSAEIYAWASFLIARRESVYNVKLSCLAARTLLDIASTSPSHSLSGIKVVSAEHYRGLAKLEKQIYPT